MKTSHSLLYLIIFSVVGGWLIWIHNSPPERDIGNESRLLVQAHADSERDYFSNPNEAKEGQVGRKQSPEEDTAHGMDRSAEEVRPIGDRSARPNPELNPASPEEMPLRSPPVAEYVDRVPSNVRQTYRAFVERFPGLDPTDLDIFYEAMLDERHLFGAEMSDEEANDYSDWLTAMERMQQAMVQERGRLLGLSLGGIDEEGRGYALIGFHGADPVYTVTTNHEAAISTAASLVRMNPEFDSLFGMELDGTDLYVNVNDHGEIYEHPEFQWPDDGGSRIVVSEVPGYSGGQRGHMTHVAGTVAAYGYNEAAMGMAPRVWIRALIQQTQSHITGYGMRYPGQPERSVMGTTSLGQDDPNCRGQYTVGSRTFDSTLFDYPYYVHFYAASNDGSDFNTLTVGNNLAKNVILVGSVNDVTRDAEGNYVSGGNISGFSSRGPARDGRIKPDIVGNGQGVFSPDSATGYGSRQGTSMATPNASGSAVLLIQYFNKRFPGQYMRASTTRALIINTSDDLGNPGPDYTYGYGIMNTRRAAEIIQTYADQPASRVLIEDRLNEGETHERIYTSDGTNPIRVTLAWIDPEGPASWQCNNDKSLVNDLNLRLIGPDDSVHLPFVMPFTTGVGSTPAYDPSLYSAHAVQGVNDTDNVIQVLIDNPLPGDYVLEVSHAGSLTYDFQRYSVAVSGMVHSEAHLPSSPVITGNTPQSYGADFMILNVDGSGFLLGAEVTLKKDNFDPVSAYAIETEDRQIRTRLDSANMAPGYWDVQVRNPDGSESVVSNAFLVPAGSGDELPPVFTSEADTVGSVGELYTYLVVTDDEDTPLSELTLTAETLPGWLTFNDHGNGTATLTGTPADTGSFPVLLSVTDGAYVIYQSFDLMVLPEGGNTPPEFLTETLATGYVLAPYSATIEATDADGHTLTLSTDPLPSWLTFTDHGDGTGTLSATPPTGSVGSPLLTFHVSDGFDTTSTTLPLTIEPRAIIEFPETQFTVDEGAGSLSIPVRRTIQDVGLVSVNYTTHDGTASAGDHYETTSGTLAWEDGDMSDQWISIPIIDDEIRDINRTFSVVLSNALGIAQLGDTTADVTIIDNDTPPGVDITPGPLHLINHGSVSTIDEVHTLTRTGDPEDAFQGYVLSFDEAELSEVGDYVEIQFALQANTGNNQPRQVSWGFFEGDSVSADGQTGITGDWEGYVHQLGTRTSDGTSGAGVYRQGSGSTPLMDHSGGGTSMDGDSVTFNLPPLNQNQAVPATFHLQRISATEIRVTTTYPTPHNGGDNSGSGGGIDWSFTSEDNVCTFRSIHSLVDGPTTFNGFAVASRGEGWTLQEISMESNATGSVPPLVIDISEPADEVVYLTPDEDLIVVGEVIHPDPPVGTDPVVSWTVLAAPDDAIVNFQPDDAVNTTISFNLEGEYLLHVHALWDELETSREFTVHVTSDEPPPESTLIVDWGQTASTGQIRDGAAPESIPADLSGNGQVDDLILTYPFSDTFSLSPAVGSYEDVPIYGGIRLEGIEEDDLEFLERTLAGHFHLQPSRAGEAPGGGTLVSWGPSTETLLNRWTDIGNNSTSTPTGSINGNSGTFRYRSHTTAIVTNNSYDNPPESPHFGYAIAQWNSGGAPGMHLRLEGRDSNAPDGDFIQLNNTTGGSNYGAALVWWELDEPHHAGQVPVAVQTMAEGETFALAVRNGAQWYLGEAGQTDVGHLGDIQWTAYTPSDGNPQSLFANHSGPDTIGALSALTFEEITFDNITALGLYGERIDTTNGREIKIICFNAAAGTPDPWLSLNATLFWSQEDFLNDGHISSVSFQEDSFLRIHDLETNGLSGDLRWLIREGDAYYLSETTLNPTDGLAELTFPDVGQHGSWALWNGIEQLEFDPATADWQPMTFSDVTALGLAVSQTTHHNVPIEILFQRFAVAALLSEPEDPEPFNEWLQTYNYDAVDPDTFEVEKAGRMVTLREAFLLGENPDNPGDVTGIRMQGMDGLLFGTLPDRLYQVEWSEDLVEWTPYEDTFHRTSGGSEEVYYPLPEPGDETRRFYRVRIAFP
ncbi:MAG: S8 family serine peptidase [Opitutales bacterium]|nr:S8 family serine peptidase [Opitutales bacterium]